MSCGAPIVWGRTTKTGSKIPLDPERVPEGTIAVVGTHTEGGPLVLVLGLKDLAPAREQGVIELYRSHWASCPDAEKWRQPRTKGATL
jgi:hypothetical protein